MKDLGRDRIFGTYKGEVVMVVSGEDIALEGAMCVIEYHHPLLSKPMGTRERVAWRELENLNGPGVDSR